MYCHAEEAEHRHLRTVPGLIQKRTYHIGGGKGGEESTFRDGRTHMCVPIAIPETLASSSITMDIYSRTTSIQKHPIHKSFAHLQNIHSRTTPSNHPPPTLIQDRPQQSHTHPHPTPQQGRYLEAQPCHRAVLVLHLPDLFLQPLTSHLLSTAHSKPDHRTTP
jgi:hypothetical protein